MIEVKDIHKSFGTLEVLKGVNLRVKQGEIVAIVGKSGAGKTTLLQIIGTLDKADSGKVEINGVDVSVLSEKELAQFRNKHIGFIFQFCFTDDFKHFRFRRNTAEGIGMEQTTLPIHP